MPTTTTFAIMSSSTTFSRWQADAIRQLLAIDALSCSLLILDARPAPASRLAFLRAQPFAMLPWLFYMRWIRRKVASLQRVDLSEELSGASRISCTVTRKGKYSEHFSDADIEEIRSHRPDFILRFGFGIIRGAILEAAPHGVWSFHHGDEQEFRGSPPGFWEVYRNHPVTGAIMQRLTERLDAGVILRKGWVKTKLSYPKNLDQILTATSAWPRSVCLEIMAGENKEALTGMASRTSAPITRTPGAAQILSYVLRSSGRTVRTIWRVLLFTDVWNIGVLHAPIVSLLEGKSDRRIDWYPRSPESFLADPFVLPGDRRDEVRIVIEVFPFARGKGEIGATTYSAATGTFSEISRLLREEHHLSYPYVLPKAAGLAGLMVPESHRSREVKLYRHDPENDLMVESHVLIDDLPGIDSTIVRHNGRWWLFTTDASNGPHHHLQIYHAPSVEGPWTPHLLNPVKTDVRSARPAGTPFMREGTLYRPAMDYSVKVEGRVTINRIEDLTPCTFREVPVTTVDPFADSPYPDKIHTLTECGDLTIIDGCRETLVLRSLPLLRFKLRVLRAVLMRRSEFE